MRYPRVTTVDVGHPPLPATGWVLLVTTSGGVRAHPVPAHGSVVIGRDPACDLVLEHARISRRHARISVGAVCQVEDLASRNGTLLRGARLEPQTPQVFAAGESIVAGPCSLVLLSMAASEIRTERDGSLVVVDPAGEPPPLLIAVAVSPVSVLIRGETGVGKEVLGAAIHRGSGRPGPYLRINCASFAGSLLERELFGHERGAFTGAVQARPGLLEAAAGGTVLLDEIGELPAPLQAKLLRAIEAREIYRVGGTRPVPLDVRFIAATHRDLGTDVATCRFRRDLFYRLAGITLDIPPLRQRADRLPLLALGFVEEIAGRTGARLRLSPAALARLQHHDWPGNVRELRTVVERAALLAGGAEIRAEHVLIDRVPGCERGRGPMRDAGGAPDAERAPADGDERTRIVAALEACNGNQTRAARRLGMSRSTIVHKLALYRVPRPRADRSSR